MARLGEDQATAPAALGWWERMLIRRRAVKAVRAGEPSLDLGPAPVTTVDRDGFFVVRDEGLSRHRARTVARLAPDVCSLTALRDAVSKAAAALEAAEHQEDVPTNADEAHGWTRSTDTEVLTARTQRRQARRSAARAARIATLGLELGSLREDLALVTARLGAANDQYASRVTFAAHRALLRRALHDSALVAHHPMGDLVQVALDPSYPPLPEELQRPVADIPANPPEHGGPR